MIRINLLPVKISRRQEAVRAELVLVGLAAGVVAAVLAAAFVSVNSEVNTIRAENAALQKKAVSNVRYMEVARENKELTAKLEAAEKQVCSCHRRKVCSCPLVLTLTLTRSRCAAAIEGR